MTEKITYPYNDECMVVDEPTGHYVLTEAALLSRGIDLRARLSETSTVSPENVINNVLQTASDMIYQFIHDHNFNNQMQDYMILKVPSARNIIYRAMLYQAVYVCNVGNLYLSNNTGTEPTVPSPLHTVNLFLCFFLRLFFATLHRPLRPLPVHTPELEHPQHCRGSRYRIHAERLKSFPTFSSL